MLNLTHLSASMKMKILGLSIPEVNTVDVKETEDTHETQIVDEKEDHSKKIVKIKQEKNIQKED